MKNEEKLQNFNLKLKYDVDIESCLLHELDKVQKLLKRLPFEVCSFVMVEINK